MKKIFPTFRILMTLTILIIAGCYYDNKEELYPVDPNGCDTLSVTYSGYIKATINNKCATAGCHAGISPTGYDLSNYAVTATMAANGRLMESIRHTGSSPMPLGLPKLDDCTIAKINKWVQDGAPDN